MGHWVELDTDVHHGKPPPTALEKVTIISIQTRPIGHADDPRPPFDYCLSVGQEYKYRGGAVKVHGALDGLSHEKLS